MEIKKSLIFVVSIVSYLSLYYLFVPHALERSRPSDGKIVRIAIFQPATHSALDEIAQGFVDTMQENSSLNYMFDRYNANGNKILMQAQAQEMLQKNYDLIFTIGVGCSVTVKDLCVKKQNRTPIVFTAVDDPIKLDLKNHYMTGVVDQSNYPEQLNLLLQIKPVTKKVLLVYDQSQASGLEKDKHQIRSILQQKNIELIAVEILNVSEIQQKVTGFIESCDVVMILKDNTIVSGIDSLISLCQRYQVTLLATDLNSGAKGAALAYGIYEAQSGIQAAKQAKLILEDGKLPSQVPVIAVENMIMKINCKHALLQGLSIDCHHFSMLSVELDAQGVARV